MADLNLPADYLCSKCDRKKPKREFYCRRSGKPRQPCKACASLSYKKYRKENAAKERARHRKYQDAYPDRIRAASARYRENDRERFRRIQRRADARRRSTPRGRLDNAMSAGISRSLARCAKAGRAWQDLAGYSLDELMDHLHHQFGDGMTWDNYGEWHVDHIVPLSAFNYSNPQHLDFRRAWELNNLRPLWRAENIAKRDKLAEPFQPSLEI